MITLLQELKNQSSGESESTSAQEDKSSVSPELTTDPSDDTDGHPPYGIFAADVPPACRSSLYYFPPAIGHHLVIQFGNRKLDGAQFPVVQTKGENEHDIIVPYAILKCDFDVLSDADVCKILLPCLQNAYHKLTENPACLIPTFPFFLMFAPKNAKPFGQPEFTTVKGIIMHGKNGKQYRNPQCVLCDQIDEQIPYHVYTELVAFTPGIELTHLVMQHGHIGDKIYNVMVEGLKWYRKKSAAEYYRTRADGIKHLNDLTSKER